MKGETYEQFVEKFKPKKTTDDCYTPPLIYDCVANWVANEYSVNRDEFCRPFYPGGDYEHFVYTNKIVVDNPPFSIFSKILRFYIENNIKFFLFAPAQSLFSGATENCTMIVVYQDLIYENGARVATAFVTNLDANEIRIRTAPDLHEQLGKINKRKVDPRQVIKYEYPANVMTVCKLKKMCAQGKKVTIPRAKSTRISQLDYQKSERKAIFGNGYLVSDTVVKDCEKAEGKRQVYEWQLSEREKAIIAELNKK